MRKAFSQKLKVIPGAPVHVLFSIEDNEEIAVSAIASPNDMQSF